MHIASYQLLNCLPDGVELLALPPSTDWMNCIQTADNNNKNIQVSWTLLNKKKKVFVKCFIEIQYFTSKVIALTATLFMFVFSFPSSNISLLSSIILFTVKPKMVFLLKCSVNAIQHMLKKHKNLFLKHDIPSLMKFQNCVVYLELLLR